MNKIEEVIERWFDNLEDISISGKLTFHKKLSVEERLELIEELSAVVIPKEDLDEYKRWKSEVKIVGEKITKDILQKRIRELLLIKNEEFGKSMAGRYRWQGFLECVNGLQDFLLSEEEKA